MTTLRKLPTTRPNTPVTMTRNGGELMKVVTLTVLMLLTITTTLMADLKIHSVSQVDMIGKATLQYVNTGYWTYTELTVKCKAYDIEHKLIGFNQYKVRDIIVPGFTSHTILDIELDGMTLDSVKCKTWEQ